MFLRVASGLAGISKSLFLYDTERRLLSRAILSWRNCLGSKETDYTLLFPAERKLHNSGRTDNLCSITLKDSELWFVVSQDFYWPNTKQNGIYFKIHGIYSICFRGRRGLNTHVVHKTKCLLAQEKSLLTSVTRVVWWFKSIAYEFLRIHRKHHS